MLLSIEKYWGTAPLHTTLGTPFSQSIILIILKIYVSIDFTKRDKVLKSGKTLTEGAGGIFLNWLF